MSVFLSARESVFREPQVCPGQRLLISVVGVWRGSQRPARAPDVKALYAAPGACVYLAAPSGVAGLITGLGRGRVGALSCLRCLGPPPGPAAGSARPKSRADISLFIFDAIHQHLVKKIHHHLSWPICPHHHH